MTRLAACTAESCPEKGCAPTLSPNAIQASHLRLAFPMPSLVEIDTPSSVHESKTHCQVRSFDGPTSVCVDECRLPALPRSASQADSDPGSSF